MSALWEAAAGVVGTLVSMLVFYPIDLQKTKLQAAPPFSSSAHTKTPPSILSLLLRILKTFPPTPSTIATSYAGISYKASYSVLSSFTFFFLFTLFKNRYKRAHKITKIPAHINLLLSCLAAMGNTLLTLPLDGVVVRIQTGSPLPPLSPELWSGLHPAILLSSNPAIHYTVYDVVKSLVLSDSGPEKRLSALSAFLLGLSAKR